MASGSPRDTARRALLALLLLGGWTGVAVYGVSSARALRAADLASGALALNVALLAVELLLSAFMLALFAWLLAPAPPAPAPPPLREKPRVTLVIPTFGESPRVLAETLHGVARLDWPRDRLRVVVADDTPSPADARALETAARDAGASYARRPARRGYKAGALNDALRGDPSPVVAVLDVDHVPDPAWLARAVPVLLADPRAGFVQGRLAWRNAHSWKGRMQAMFQAQFFEVVQRAKAPRGAAVFAGSGAVFRREALDDVGGFPEETLVEDFDYTIESRLRGWRGHYLPEVVARGLLPWTLPDVARQLWRWAYGITSVFVRRIGRILRADAPLAVKLECIADGAAYTGSGLMMAAGPLLALAALADVPLVRAPAALILLAPAITFAADVSTAAVGIHRAREPGWRYLLPYHVMTLAFTPVVFAATLAAYLRLGGRIEGRVLKEAKAAVQRRARGAGVAGVAGAMLGAGLVAAAVGLWQDAWHAGVWAAELGVAFLAPGLVGALDARAGFADVK